MRIKEIDIMKCLAILGIIMVHTAQKFKAMPEWLSMIFYFGQMGVQVFFMFSAYSLCLSKDTKKGFITKSYYIKRALRIIPGYWIGIVLYELVFLTVSMVKLPVVIDTNTNPFAIVINILLLNDLFIEGNNNVVPGGWSISCLWLFYLIFPFIWMALSKLKKDKFKIALLGAGIILAPIVFALIYILSNGQVIVENNSFLYFFIGNQIPSFLMGILLFIIEKMVKNKKKCKNFTRSVLSFVYWRGVFAVCEKLLVVLFYCYYFYIGWCGVHLYAAQKI